MAVIKNPNRINEFEIKFLDKFATAQVGNKWTAFHPTKLYMFYYILSFYLTQFYHFVSTQSQKHVNKNE